MTLTFYEKKIDLTSILKVLLKQYMSLPAPTNITCITPTKTDKLELDLFEVKISKDCIEKS